MIIGNAYGSSGLNNGAMADINNVLGQVLQCVGLELAAIRSSGASGLQNGNSDYGSVTDSGNYVDDSGQDEDTGLQAGSGGINQEITNLIAELEELFGEGQQNGGDQQSSPVPQSSWNPQSVPGQNAGSTQPSGLDQQIKSSQTSSDQTGAGNGASSQTIQVGTGTGHKFNVTNDSDQTIHMQFQSTDATGKTIAQKTMTIPPHATGTFEAGDNTPGIRIDQVTGSGDDAPLVNPGKEALFEDAIINGVHNGDVSDVDDNTPNQAMDVVTGNGVTYGNSQQGTGHGAYLASNDDAVLNGYAGGKLDPMNGANDQTNVINLTVRPNTQTFTNGPGVPVGSDAPI